MAADPDRWADLPEKLAGLMAVAADHGCATVVLRDPANLTWLLGARVNVPQTLDSACLDVYVEGTTDARVTIVTNRIEAPRLQDTELAGLDATWVVVDWWEGRDARLPGGDDVLADRPVGATKPGGPDLALLRRRLTDRQRGLLREVCADTAAAAGAAALRLSPTTTEYAAAGLLAHELLARELDPIVLLAGGHARLDAHRHPLPTAAPLGEKGMLVACGRRHGLVASVTRLVSFGPLDAAERDAYTRLLEVERAFLDASVVGARLGDIVRTGTAAYREQGFAPDEWHRHHQGGFSGFVPRELPASPAADDVVPEGSILAWNPSGGGWKVEDTTLVDDEGPHPLVHDDDWPTVIVGGRARPDVLAR